MDDRFQNARLPAHNLLLALAVTISFFGSTIAQAQRKADPALRSEFREPVTLASKNGVLEVRLTARQGEAVLDTVASPVKNFLLFDYEVIRGTPSDGRMSGGKLYPAPTLRVFPGETLIVHLENGLSGLTIRDYFSPQYTPKGQEVPIYPEQMTSSPLNFTSTDFTSARREIPTTSCCTSRTVCRIPTRMTFPKISRRARIGITAIFTDLPQPKSIRVWSACSPLDGRTATCRW